MSTISRRIAALEEQTPTDRERVCVFVRFGDEELTCIAASKHWPELRRQADESEQAFKQRARAAADAGGLNPIYAAVFYPKISRGDSVNG